MLPNFVVLFFRGEREKTNKRQVSSRVGGAQNLFPALPRVLIKRLKSQPSPGATNKVTALRNNFLGMHLDLGTPSLREPRGTSGGLE